MWAVFIGDFLLHNLGSGVPTSPRFRRMRKQWGDTTSPRLRGAGKDLFNLHNLGPVVKPRDDNVGCTTWVPGFLLHQGFVGRASHGMTMWVAQPGSRGQATG